MSLAPGMAVKIRGYGDGRHFAANQIDAPYTTEPSRSPYADPNLYNAAYTGYWGAFAINGMSFTLGGLGLTVPIPNIWGH
jgi:hypothetical protein